MSDLLRVFSGERAYAHPGVDEETCQSGCHTLGSNVQPESKCSIAG